MKMLRLPDVKKIVPISTAQIYKLMAAGEFPKQIKVGGSSLWLLSDIEKYIQDQIESKE